MIGPRARLAKRRRRTASRNPSQSDRLESAEPRVTPDQVRAKTTVQRRPVKSLRERATLPRSGHDRHRLCCRGACGDPLRPQDELECRRCEVHCNRVVSAEAMPEGASSSTPTRRGHTYMGCVQKVFEVEIDVDLLGELEGRRGGFGAVKARRTPLPICRSEISACYEHRTDELGCRNPSSTRYRASGRASGSSRPWPTERGSAHRDRRFPWLAGSAPCAGGPRCLPSQTAPVELAHQPGSSA